MSQMGKILHLYVEVRSVPEEGGGPVGEVSRGTDRGGVDRTESQPTPPKQRRPAPSPSVQSETALQHSTQNTPSNSNKPQARLTASPQQRCQQPSSPREQAALQRQSLLSDGPGRGGVGGAEMANHRTAPLQRTRSECEPFRGGCSSPIPTGRTTAPATPSNGRRGGTGEGGGDGRRSVVTYGYIEKANVKTVSSPYLSSRRPDKQLQEETVWVENQGLSPGPSPKLVHPGSASSHPATSPGLRHKTLNSIAKAATSRALEEFGSPQLRRRAATQVGYQQTHKNQQNQQPRCQSWTGSPVLTGRNNPRMPRSSCTLPRSPASNQLSSQGQEADSQDHPSQSMTLPPEVQHCWTGRQSPRLASKLSPALERGPGKPASILHHSPQLQASSESPRLCHRVNFKLGDSGPTEGGGGQISPANSPEVARKLAQEASKLSTIFQARSSQSPTPPLDSPRVDAHKLGRPVSPAAAPQYSQYSQQKIDLQKTEPEHTKDSAVGSPCLRQQRSDIQGTVSTVRPAKSPPVRARQQQQDSPKPQRHPVGHQWGDTGGADSPNIQSEYVEDSGSPDAEMRQREDAPRPKAGQHIGQCPSRSSSVMHAKQGDSPSLRTGLDGQGESPRLEYRPGQCEGQASPGCGGRDSVVSSGQQTGQTGALSISQESNTSHKKTGREDSNSQSVSLSCSLAPSMHSQRVARAKWEFLFGTVSEDSTATGVKDPQDSTTPPSIDSFSDSRPTLTPPRSLVLRVRGEALANHSVQHVEVELVTPPPAVGGACPRTGIIRRTLQYSETDLDAVPLRCYRETNIDELLAEQDEADSAFGSNRSVIGTSEEEDGGWGDRKHRRAAPEEEEVFTLGLERLSSQSSLGATLKSPIDIPAPSHASEEGLDTFSRHFESIMESHRAKGTSYSSLDSEDLLSSSQTVFTFDLPTLTPEIQGLICQSARLIELSFAPLAPGENPGMSTTDSAHTRTDSAHTTAPESSGEEGTAGNCSSERPPTLESDPESDLIERLCLGSTDTLTNGSRVDRNSAKRLAKRLYSLDGFKKSDVARHLSKNNEFSKMVAEEYLHFFNFTGMSLEQALRAFLREFALMGETQERERVLAHFSRRYLACNPSVIPSEDGVHTLTCALMLLNTDLHGHNIGKRMTCPQFIANLEGLNDGADFPKDLLKALYSAIKTEKLQWTIDEEELRKSFSELADSNSDSASRTMKRINSCGNPLLSGSQPASTLTYKQGFLVRKVHADPDGKRTPRGKRGWKSFYAVLKGLILYLQKGEYRPDKQLSDEDLKNAISIHHSLAMKAADYSKRPHVFYLRTADWRVFLFQAQDADQMQSWITRINTVAAIFSSSPFPAAIGSQKKFSRPLLPASSTKLSQEEQVQSHEARFRATSAELAELCSYPPERKVKGRELEEYRQRNEYLEFEKTRYGTYAMLLRAKLRCGEEDLARFESRLFEGPEAEDNGLQRAHSSPTLPHDPSQGGAAGQGKRSEGQRHSYRQAVKQ
ncbi:uncharacterized protein LOC121325187 isoform X1 [Polyodon spathula]|uniref:uncharacterized protein LOC121325187 isoform X1 n=1 Tax=Polyodon spathula TaxID=7913 RepID=UPI001B7F542D|nr:uncharacterized protein LOC121325187 isoform X1 [Polyodon spathula]